MKPEKGLVIWIFAVTLLVLLSCFASPKWWVEIAASGIVLDGLLFAQYRKRKVARKNFYNIFALRAPTSRAEQDYILEIFDIVHCQLQQKAIDKLYAECKEYEEMSRRYYSAEWLAKMFWFKPRTHYEYVHNPRYKVYPISTLHS